jgi:hypothetical protein
MKVGRPQGGPNGMTTAQMQVSSLAAATVAGTGYGQQVAYTAPVYTPVVAPAAVSPATTLATTAVAQSTKCTVVLDNMVPLAEASDPDLKGEVQEEAATHGPLRDILIEVVDNKFVRIKLFYLSPQSALKAYNAMNGRYFGGVAITASLE